MKKFVVKALSARQLLSRYTIRELKRDVKFFEKASMQDTADFLRDIIKNRQKRRRK